MIAAIYARKSTEQNGVGEDAKSVTRQVEHAKAYAEKKGWTVDPRYIYIDDAVSGAEWKNRPEFNRFRAALDPKPPFDALTVSDLTRIGRDTVRTPAAVLEIEDAGVEIWSYLNDSRISMASESGEVQTVVQSLVGSFERRGATLRTHDSHLPVFRRLPPPTDADLAARLTRRHRRVRGLLIRRGRGPEDEAGSDLGAAEAPLFAGVVAASLHGRVALGPRAGPPGRRLRSAAAATATGRRSARLEGFSLQAAVAGPARRRDQREKVCRYIGRPPLAVERLTERTGEPLLYQFRRPWRDGSPARRLDPRELLERLAARVPPPRRPLLADHGVLAPRARWRSAIVPPPADGARADAGGRSPRRWPWARRLRRVFAIEVLVGERGGGARRILGAVTDPHAVRRLLAALGLAAEPPPGPVPAA